MKQGMWRWTMGAAFRSAGGREKKKTKQHHLTKKKKDWRVQKLISHSPFLFLRFLWWYRKQWVDVATPWGLHMCDGRRPYTDMMCLTKAAAGGQDRGGKKQNSDDEKAPFKSTANCGNAAAYPHSWHSRSHPPVQPWERRSQPHSSSLL